MCNIVSPQKHDNPLKEVKEREAKQLRVSVDILNPEANRALTGNKHNYIHSYY